MSLKTHVVAIFNNTEELHNDQVFDGYMAHDAALDDGPPPSRIPRLFKSHLAGWNSISQWATAQVADGIGGNEGHFVNLPPVRVPRRGALTGTLSSVGRAAELRVPSVFIPVASFTGRR